MGEKSPISVTIKYGQGYEDTWANFSGSVDSVQDDIIAFFGLEDIDGLTLSDIVVNATNVAHGTGNAAKYLGGTVINEHKAGSREEAAGDDPWQAAEAAKAKAEPEPDPVEVALAQIEASGSVKDLKVWWAQNQDVYNANDNVKQAYSTKGKALKVAEAA